MKINMMKSVMNYGIFMQMKNFMERLKQKQRIFGRKMRSIFRNQLSEDEFSNHCDFELTTVMIFEKTKEQIQQKMQRMQIDGDM